MKPINHLAIYAKEVSLGIYDIDIDIDIDIPQNKLRKFDEINSQKEHIDYLANFDVLTSLPNRKHFITKLSQVLHSQSECAILILDLDNFKSMNDTLGHLFGDYLLESIANILLEITMEKKVSRQHDIEKSIKEALANDGFTMNYQPQVDLKTGKIIAFEALLRMKSLSYGPGEFIPVAEENGLIIEIGHWPCSQPRFNRSS